MDNRLIECPCGVVLRGASDDAVISAAQSHAKTVHDMDLDDDQARSMVRPA